MRKISANNRFRLSKPGNIPTVLIIIVVIAFVMMAIVGFLTVLINRQFAAKSDMQAYDRINTVADVVEMRGEMILSELITNEMTDWNTFVDANKDQISSQLFMIIPSDIRDQIESITVSYDNVVEKYVHGGSPQGFQCIVISFGVTENGEPKTCNVGFFVGNALSYTNEGAVYEKGEYILTWMS